MNTSLNRLVTIFGLMCVEGKYPILTEFGPPMWQAEAGNVSFLSASPATAVDLIMLTQDFEFLYKLTHLTGK